MKRRRVAILDFGTNTFNLLITEVTADSFFPLHREKIPVKIGENGIIYGYINREAEARAIDAALQFCRILKRHEIHEVYANATSAFRNAINGPVIADKIEKLTGIKINIISGATEAELIYLGVRKALHIGVEKSLILDIGGGSNEFIICDHNQIFWKGSFEIGSQRLYDIFHGHDPILTEDIARLNLFLEEKLETLMHAVCIHKPKTLIGASGAFDTLNEIYRQQNGLKLNGYTEFEMPLDKYHEICADIISKNKEERLKIPGMLEMRADMIVVASCLINFVIQRCNINRLRTSAYSLKEGMLYNVLDEVRKEIKIKNIA